MNRRILTVGIGCALIMALVVLVGCGSSQQVSGVSQSSTTAGGNNKILIGIVNSLTGAGSDLGLAGQQGAEIAAAEINASGGINGKQIQLIYRDDQSIPAAGVSAVNELIAKEGVKVVMGANLSPVATAVNQIINDQKVLFLTMGTAMSLLDPSKYPYTFGLNVHADIEAKALIQYLVEGNGAKKIGMINDSTALGQGGRAVVVDALKGYGLSLVGQEVYNPGDTDMSGSLLKLKNAGAETVVVWGASVADFAQVTNGLEKMGWYPILGSGIAVHQVAFRQLAAKKAADNWVGTMQKAFTYPAGGTVSSGIKQFIDQVQQKYGKDTKSYVPNAGIWYDMIKLYAQAVTQTKAQDPDGIKKYFESVSSYQGLVAKYGFSPTDHAGFALGDLAVAHALSGDAFSKERAK